MMKSIVETSLADRDVDATVLCLDRRGVVVPLAIGWADPTPLEAMLPAGTPCEIK